MDHPNAINLGSVLAREPAGRTGQDAHSRATLRFVLACCAIPGAWTVGMVWLSVSVRF